VGGVWALCPVFVLTPEPFSFIPAGSLYYWLDHLVQIAFIEWLRP
jgi:hypothetical protein